MTIINYAFGGVILALLSVLVWESSKALHERKMRRRMGLTDYYDNPIKQVNKNDPTN